MAAVHYAVNWKARTEDGEGDENSAVTPSVPCEQRFPVNGNAKQHAELKAGLGATTVHKAAVGQAGWSLLIRAAILPQCSRHHLTIGNIFTNT